MLRRSVGLELRRCDHEVEMGSASITVVKGKRNDKGSGLVKNFEQLVGSQGIGVDLRNAGSLMLTLNLEEWLLKFRGSNRLWLPASSWQDPKSARPQEPTPPEE